MACFKTFFLLALLATEFTDLGIIYNFKLGEMSPTGDQENPDTISNAALYTIMILMMLFGSANTLVMKAQDDFATDGINVHGKPAHFIHPYFQCFNMFLGELCCLIPFFLKKLYYRRKLHQGVDANLKGQLDD